jgi:hypothetical protein
MRLAGEVDGGYIALRTDGLRAGDARFMRRERRKHESRLIRRIYVILSTVFVGGCTVAPWAAGVRGFVRDGFRAGFVAFVVADLVTIVVAIIVLILVASSRSGPM